MIKERCFVVVTLLLFSSTAADAMVVASTRGRCNLNAKQTAFSSLVASVASSSPTASTSTSTVRTSTNLAQSSNSYESTEQLGRRQRGQRAISAPSWEIPPLVYRYIDQCNRKPFITKGITAGIVAGFGDMISQIIFSVQFSWTRFFSFALVGLLYNGPVVHAWYEFLWKVGGWMESKMGSSKKVQTLSQIALDQTIGISFLYPGYFYVFELLESFVSMRAPNLAQAHMKCVQQIVSIMIMNYRLWPFVNLVNFTVVPGPLRVLFANVVAVFWNIFLFAKVA